MADIAEIIVRTRCVDLGLFVEVIGTLDNKKICYYAILDFGTFKGKEPFREYFDKIIRKMKSNAIQKGHPGQVIVDYVHFSHFDEDHYNLFVDLGKYCFDKHEKKIHINKLVFGSEGKKKMDPIKKAFKDYFDYQQIIEITNTGIIGDRDNPYLFTNDGATLGDNIDFPSENISLRIIPLMYRTYRPVLSENDIRSGQLSKKGVLINTGSSMLLITVIDTQEDRSVGSYIFTGDATVYTLKLFNKAPGFKFQKEDKTWQIPHHGAKNNMGENKTEKGKEPYVDFSVLKTTLGIVDPRYVCVSARCVKPNFAHPYLETMDVYRDFLDKKGSLKNKMITCGRYDGSRREIILNNSIHCNNIFQTITITLKDNWTEGVYAPDVQGITNDIIRKRIIRTLWPYTNGIQLEAE